MEWMNDDDVADISSLDVKIIWNLLMTGLNWPFWILLFNKNININIDNNNNNIEYQISIAYFLDMVLNPLVWMETCNEMNEWMVVMMMILCPKQWWWW